MAKLYGIYRGVVTDNVDLESRRRVKVTVPEELGSVAIWALPCVPINSRRVPKIGAQVWVMFEGGNDAYPVWVGVLP